VAATTAETRFRAEARDWLESALPGGWGSERRVSGELATRIAEGRAWQRKLYEGGWAALGWPEEYGGRPATATERLIFAEETARLRAPEPADIFGLYILGPTLLAIGSEEHRRRFLPPIVRGETMWCETFSEPGAGSDMANVQTRARRDGDELVISGRKRWNSLAQFADWTMLLCRTGPPESIGARPRTVDDGPGRSSLEGLAGSDFIARCSGTTTRSQPRSVAGRRGDTRAPYPPR